MGNSLSINPQDIDRNQLLSLTEEQQQMYKQWQQQTQQQSQNQQEQNGEQHQAKPEGADNPGTKPPSLDDDVPWLPWQPLDVKQDQNVVAVDQRSMNPNISGRSSPIHAPPTNQPIIPPPTPTSSDNPTQTIAAGVSMAADAFMDVSVGVSKAFWRVANSAASLQHSIIHQWRKPKFVKRWASTAAHLTGVNPGVIVRIGSYLPHSDLLKLELVSRVWHDCLAGMVAAETIYVDVLQADENSGVLQELSGPQLYVEGTYSVEPGVQIIVLKPKPGTHLLQNQIKPNTFSGLKFRVRRELPEIRQLRPLLNEDEVSQPNASPASDSNQNGKLEAHADYSNDSLLDSSIPEETNAILAPSINELNRKNDATEHDLIGVEATEEAPKGPNESEQPSADYNEHILMVDDSELAWAEGGQPLYESAGDSSDDHSQEMLCMTPNFILHLDPTGTKVLSICVPAFSCLTRDIERLKKQAVNLHQNDADFFAGELWGVYGWKSSAEYLAEGKHSSPLLHSSSEIFPPWREDCEILLMSHVHHDHKTVKYERGKPLPRIRPGARTIIDPEKEAKLPPEFPFPQHILQPLKKPPFVISTRVPSEDPSIQREFICSPLYSPQRFETFQSLMKLSLSAKFISCLEDISVHMNAKQPTSLLRNILSCPTIDLPRAFYPYFELLQGDEDQVREVLKQWRSYQHRIEILMAMEEFVHQPPATLKPPSEPTIPKPATTPTRGSSPERSRSRGSSPAKPPTGSEPNLAVSPPPPISPSSRTSVPELDRNSQDAPATQEPVINFEPPPPPSRGPSPSPPANIPNGSTPQSTPPPNASQLSVPKPTTPAPDLGAPFNGLFAQQQTEALANAARLRSLKTQGLCGELCSRFLRDIPGGEVYVRITGFRGDLPPILKPGGYDELVRKKSHQKAGTVTSSSGISQIAGGPDAIRLYKHVKDKIMPVLAYESRYDSLGY